MHRRHPRLTQEAKKFLENVPATYKARAEHFTEKFARGGQEHVAKLIFLAAEENRLEKAMGLLMKFWNFHWSYQKDDVRGDPGYNYINHIYLDKLYRELQIIPPWDRGE